jgi:VWFA-related protein
MVHSRRHSSPAVSALLAVAVILPATASEQEKPSPSRKGSVAASADVTLVEVPVYVVGKDGRPVRGLSKSDFELFDEGRPARVWDLDVIDLSDFGRQTVTPDVPLPAAARRHFLFLFDLTFSRPLDVARARTAARHFVQSGMKAGDLGAVASVDVEKGLKFVLSFTSDRDQLDAALATLGLPSLTSPAADPLALTIFNPSLASTAFNDRPGGRSGSDAEFADVLSAFKQMQEKIHDTYAQGRIRSLATSMRDLARTLNSIHGRKNVIFFSEGFDTKLLSGVTGESAGRETGDNIVFGQLWKVESEDRYGRNEVRRHMEEMLDVFRRTDCVLHAVDVSGLRTLGGGVEADSASDEGPAARLGSRGRGRDSLYLMSSETGGELFENSNDLGEHLQRLLDQTELIYLLTYPPEELKEPGRYHNLKVKVKAPGAHASFRAGYYEPRPYTKLNPMERRLLAAQQIAYGLPRADIPARVIATPILAPSGGSAVVPIIVEIPGAGLVNAATSQKLNLEVYAYATDQALKVKDFLTQNISLDLARVGPQLAASGIKLYGDLTLPPGTFWLRVLLRNADTGLSGLVIAPVTVPPKESKELFVLSPLFHETPGKWVMVKAIPRPAAPPPGPYPFVSQGESFIPAAEPVLDPSRDTKVSVFVYNAPAVGDLDVRGEIRGKSGVRLGPAVLTEVASSRNGTAGPLNLLCTFRPEKLEKGGYTLWVGVRDRISGAEGETLGFFRVQ